MRFKLWGTRGSIPSPLASPEIKAKLVTALSQAGRSSLDLNDPAAINAFVSSLPLPVRGTAGGDTSCIEVRSGGNLIIFDCGSGMRPLGMELMGQEFGRGEGVAHIFISHTHWDHMIGWPFFVPGYIPGNRFIIYGVHSDLEERFRIQQTAPRMFPISLDAQGSHVTFKTIGEGETISIGRTQICNILFTHAGDSYGYRVEDEDGILVYASDSEYKSLDPADTDPYVEFFRDADALIFDAMFSLPESYRKEDWGHSSAIAGADLATRAGVRRLLLFHHDPYASDEQIWSQREEAEDYLKTLSDRPPCQVIVAYDGFEMELWREAGLETDTTVSDGGVVLNLSGRLVESTTPTALAVIQDGVARADGDPVVINLAGLVHVDNDGLLALFSARRRWCPLLLCGISQELQRTFARAGILDQFAIYDTPEDALTAMGQVRNLRPGSKLDNRYEIAQRLDHSPLGALYRAHDRVANRPISLLVLCPSLGEPVAASILNTARHSFDLRQPLVADIFAAGTEGPLHYVVMEHVPGHSIRQLLSQQEPQNESSEGGAQPISATQAADIALQVCEALAYLHSQNVTHGGLCADNVILREDGSIKLTQVGISQLQTGEPLREMPAHLGPLDYLAPEQLQGYSSRPRTDLYALGTLLYEMLTGETPFGPTESDRDLISLKLRQSPVPPRRRNPNLSQSIEHLVLTLLRRSPQGRPASAVAVSQVLTNLIPMRPPSPLLGREDLCQKLHRHVDRVMQGQSGFVVVRGPRGIGKSRLVTSLAPPHPEKAIQVLYGELYAAEDRQPYKLFIRTLRPALLAMPAHRLSRLLQELDHLAQPLMVLFPDLQPSISSFVLTDIDCGLLDEAVCELLRRMAGNGPVFLILDSLQWIDVASLRLLNRIVHERIPQLLIAALHRTEAVDQRHPLRRLLDDLEAWIDEELDVGPLGPIEVHQIASTINAGAPPDFGLWLYSETEGNPLHTEQLIQAYLEGPGGARHPGERKTAATLEDVILRRLELLPGGALAMLRQAAVLGYEFQLDQLCAALDRPGEQVLTNLDDALRAGFISGHTLEDRYRFGHPLIREVIYAEMLSGVRQSHHWRAARVLERVGTAGLLDERIDRLAHHLFHAAEHEKAMAYLARATRRARHLCAYEAALHYVDQALSVVERLNQVVTNDREREHRKKQQTDLLAARTKLEELSAQSY
jgi:serine/threonine protein kinase/phosphoribosyl 1,2-cyclic phosphodiesterase/anti-anti-sigma regulatory factor